MILFTAFIMQKDITLFTVEYGLAFAYFASSTKRWLGLQYSMTHIIVPRF